MVLIVDGSSEIGAHVQVVIGNLNCFYLEQAEIRFFFKYLFSYTRAQRVLSYKLIISTMHGANPWFLY